MSSAAWPRPGTRSTARSRAGSNTCTVAFSWRPSGRMTVGRSTPATTWALVTTVSASTVNPLPESTRLHARPLSLTVEAATRAWTSGGSTEASGGGPVFGVGRIPEKTSGKLASTTAWRRSCSGFGARGAADSTAWAMRRVAHLGRDLAGDVGEGGQEEPEEEEHAGRTGQRPAGVVGLAQDPRREQPPQPQSDDLAEGGTDAGDGQEHPDRQQQPQLGVEAVDLVEDERGDGGGHDDAEDPSAPAGQPGEEPDPVPADRGQRHHGHDRQVEGVHRRGAGLRHRTAGYGAAFFTVI